VSILKKQSGQNSDGGPAVLWLADVLTNSQIKILQCSGIFRNAVVRAVHNAVMKLRLL
jgi:hypothetical protein